ncbi:MAG: O-antigen ligase family protein [Flavobacteriales bacterium]|nr:O-antigen ligase family protein [Flavobacteriales bacterium]
MEIKDDISFVKGVANVLAIILFFKIAGYVTLTENITLTRVLKVIIRITMTVWIWSVYKKILNRGNVSSFQFKNMLSPLLYALYCALGFSSLLWSTDPGYSLLQLSMNIESFFFAFLFIKTVELLRVNYPNSTFKLSATISVAIFFVLLYFIVGMYVDPDKFYRLTHGGEVARLGGFMMNPNELGMLAVVGIACSLVELTNARKKGKQLLLIAVMLYALIVTGSRSSMISFMLVAFYFIKRSDRKKLKLFIYSVLFLSIPVIVNTIFIKQGDLEEVLSMTGRLPFWKALLTEGLPKAPFFGFGYMRIAYTDAFHSVHSYAGKMTHNTFIQALMNLGFVGLSVVLIQVTITIRAFIKSTNMESKLIFVGVFIPILINSFTEFGIFGEANFGILFYQLLIWLFVIEYSKRFSLKQQVQLEKKKIFFIKNNEL